MPYTTGPYEQFSTLPAPPKTKLVAARKIDACKRGVNFDADGNPEGMDPTAQRVILAIAFNSGPMPDIIDDRSLEDRRARIAASLDGIVNEGAIRDVQVFVEALAPGVVDEHVTYFNLTTAKPDTVVLK
jgi:hypothetical protein